MNRNLPWLLVLGLLIALYAMRGIADTRGDRLAFALDSIAALQPTVDSLKAEARQADTALRIATDTIVRIVERTRVVQVVAADSVRAHADSVGNVYLDSLLAASKAEVDALEQLAAQRLLWGETWRDYALTLEQQNAQLQIASTLAYGMLRSERRKRTIVQAGLALAVAGAVVSAVR